MLVFGAVCCVAKNNARADVFMKDGTVKENVEIKLPKGWDKSLKIKVDSKEETLRSEDVGYFVLWHDENPEQKAEIRSVGIGEYNHKKDKAERRDNKGWMAVCAQGDYLSYLVWFNKIKLTKGSIKYEIDDNSHYFLKKDSEHAFRIPLNLMQPRRTRDWLKAFLADDQELAERITDKGYFDKKNPYHQGNNYNPFLFEQIAEDYNPQR